MAHDQFLRVHNCNVSHGLRFCATCLLSPWGGRTRKGGRRRVTRTDHMGEARRRLIRGWDEMGLFATLVACARGDMIRRWEAYEGTERRTVNRGTVADRRTQ